MDLVNPIIVSRHPATITMLRLMFQTAEHAESVTADDIRGRTVIGNLPLDLAAHAESVIAVGFASPPPRGVELTVDDIRGLGGLDLNRFRVERIG